jgi:hypothetical protein
LPLEGAVLWEVIYLLWRSAALKGRLMHASCSQPVASHLRCTVMKGPWPIPCRGSLSVCRCLYLGRSVGSGLLPKVLRTVNVTLTWGQPERPASDMALALGARSTLSWRAGW